MPTRQKVHGPEEALSSQRSARSVTGAPAMNAPPRSQLAKLIQRARVELGSLSPRDVLQLQSMIGNRAARHLLGREVQRQPRAEAASTTALPQALKAGVEALSGMPLDDVRVHYGSPEPAALGALAYTRGAEIHLAPGQEQHLPHEVWHAVQQKQGRVAATRQLAGVAINADPRLEREADELGPNALRMAAADRVAAGAARVGAPAAAAPAQVIQGKFATEPEPWKALLLKYTSQLEKLNAIDKSETVHLDVFELDQVQGGATGFTFASLVLKNGSRVTIRNARDLEAVTKEQLTNVSSIEIAVAISKKESLYSGGQATVDRDEAGTILSLVHELERHVFPFYDLFLDATVAQLSAEFGDPSALNALHTKVITPQGEFNAETQHRNPELTTNTVASVLRYLSDNGNQVLNRRTLFRLAVDSTRNGAGLAAVSARASQQLKQLPIWNAYVAVATKVAAATPGALVVNPRPGRRVLIVDGAFMGMEGVIGNEALTPENSDPGDDFIVHLDNTHTATAVPKSWCLFLA